MTTANPTLDVRLDNFEGPLDLLLYLIRKNDLEIADIPIAQITTEYLAYLDIMKDLNLEVAGEFLVMASTLMQIKAQMLLPSPESVEETGPDPRSELVSKLMEYQRFKEASAILTGWNDKAKDVYYRHVPARFAEEEYVLKASTVDLLAAFKRVLDAAPREVGQVMREEIPIEVKIREILDMLEAHASIAFEEVFRPGMRKIDLIVTFMALLELVRLRQVVAAQAEIFGGIRLYRPEHAPVARVQPIEAAPEPAPVLSPVEELKTEESIHGTNGYPENS